jgi:seryl-tRNA synthetase
MLDARSLEGRRDEIAESIRRRGVKADLDGAIALHAQVATKQHELNETNRRRNEHQERGKRKLTPRSARSTAPRGAR